MIVLVLPHLSMGVFPNLAGLVAGSTQTRPRSPWPSAMSAAVIPLPSKITQQQQAWKTSLLHMQNQQEYNEHNCL